MSTFKRFSNHSFFKFLFFFLCFAQFSLFSGQEESYEWGSTGNYPFDNQYFSGNSSYGADDGQFSNQYGAGDDPYGAIYGEENGQYGASDGYYEDQYRIDDGQYDSSYGGDYNQYEDQYEADDAWYGINDSPYDGQYGADDPWYRADAARVDLRYWGGRGVGFNHGYSTVGILYSPIYIGTISPFVDLRAHVLNNSTFASNIGFGFRSYYPEDSAFRIFGLNAYFDYRQVDHRSEHPNQFTRFERQNANVTQFGIGFEALGMIDLRGNAYIPFGKRRSLISKCVFDDYQDGFFMIDRQYSSALYGVDAEIGSYLANRQTYDVYGAVGPYYYRDDLCNRLFGGRVRLKLALKKYLCFEVSATHDPVFQTRFQGQVSFQLLFPSLMPTNSARVIPVQRSEIIALNRCCCWETNF